MHKEHHGFLFGLLAAVSGAVLAVFIKLASEIPTETLVFARFILCLPFILAIALYKKVDLSFKKMPGHLLRSLSGLVSMYCYFYAIKSLPLVNALTLSNTSPLFMPLIVLIFLRLVVSKLRYATVFLGFVGVVILLRPTNLSFDLGSWAGLGTGFFSAFSYFSIRQLSKTESTETILAYYFLICSALTFAPMILVWEPITDPMSWVYLAGLGIFSFLYQYAMTRSYTLVAATRMSTLNYLAVVFGGLSGWWIFNEVPDLWVLAGSVLIIGSALIALFDNTPPHRLGGGQGAS